MNYNKKVYNFHDRQPHKSIDIDSKILNEDFNIATPMSSYHTLIDSNRINQNMTAAKEKHHKSFFVIN